MKKNLSSAYYINLNIIGHVLKVDMYGSQADCPICEIIFTIVRAQQLLSVIVS